MRTCSARIRDPIATVHRGYVPVRHGAAGAHVARARSRAFVLVEMILVVSILALFVVMVQTNLFGVMRRSQFQADMQEFVSSMQMAASAAAESGRRYGMIIDMIEQTYLLHEITSSNLDTVLDEKIIVQGQFSESCRVDYVEFDFGGPDDKFTNRKATFVAGHAGWFYGGKIVFRDENEQPHTVLVSRITPIIEVVEGDPPLMALKAKDEVPFL
jgi:type II secretory pathway pseudopilin PulG